MKSGYIKSLCIVALVFLFLGSSMAADERLVLQFGVFSYRGVDNTTRQYQPIVDYLNATLHDVRIELRVLVHEDILRGVQEGTLDLVTTNPTNFLMVRHSQPLTGVIATLVNRTNDASHSYLGGTIVALGHRSDINSLQDIRGKTVAAPSINHMGGYRSQAYELFHAGIHLPRDIRQLIQVGEGGHEGAVQAVLEGRADVGFIRDGVLEEMEERGSIKAGALKVINQLDMPHFPNRVSTRLYPEWPVFALPHVNESAIRHIAAALYALEPDHPAAMEAGIYGYTIPADYLPVEELSRTLRLPPYDISPEFTLADVWHRWRWAIILGASTLAIIIILTTLVAISQRLLRQRDYHNRLLLSCLGEGVYGADLEGRCTFINQAALKMLGAREESVLGKNQHELFHHHYPDGRKYPMSRCPIYLTSIDGETRIQEERFFRMDGSGFPVDLAVAPLRATPHSPITGTVVVFSDSTQRVEIRNALLRTNQELERRVASEVEQRQARERAMIEQSRVAAMGSMLSAISHHWRQPLNIITLTADDIRERFEMDELDRKAVDAAVDQICNTAMGVSATIDSVLGLINADEAPELFDPLQASAATVRLLEAECLYHSIHILRQLNGEASGPFEPLAVQTSGWKLYGPPSAFNQVLFKLMVNAKDAILLRRKESGRPQEGHITIGFEQVNQLLHISVEDNGGGIDPDIRQHLFEPFFTTKDVNFSKDAIRGMGVGLYIARMSVEKHLEGRIVIEDGIQGARFVLKIPLGEMP